MNDDLQTSLGVLSSTKENESTSLEQEVLDSYTLAQRAITKLSGLSLKETPVEYNIFLDAAKNAYEQTFALESEQEPDYFLICDLYQRFIDASSSYIDRLFDKRRGTEIAISIQLGTFSLRKD